MLIYLVHAGFRSYDISYIGENLGLAYISSNLQKHGYTTRILDCLADYLDEERLLHVIKNNK
ncbi:MAG: hypothetical protein LBM93_09755, partial [Oscillospiraceae bacterium]|nr:hypothetical protein [Oscillospiraceae bacterium]